MCERGRGAMPPPKTSRGFSFFGSSNSAKKVSSVGGSKAVPLPSLILHTDRDVYKPGDQVLVTIEIRNNSPNSSLGMTSGNNAESSLLIERLAFEMKGMEKLDVQWFSTQKPSPDSKRRRGEYVFMECLATSLVSNQIVNPGETKTYLVRTILPSIIPPSYRGATIRYLYYIRCLLSGQSLLVENGHFHEESSIDLAELEARVPLQIWATQATNGLPIEGQSDGIVPASTLLLDVYWKEMDGDSDWATPNEMYDGIEEGYESSRDEISSVSSYNPTKENLHAAFGSSLSLQSSCGGRSSKHDASYLKERTSIHSYTPLPQLSVAEVLYDSSGDMLSPGKSSAMVSSQQLKHSKSLPTDDDLGVASVPGAVIPLA